MRRLQLLSLLLLAPAPVAQTVHVVDGAGGAAFTDIPPAVATAVSGDTILVKPGSYSAFTIAGKTLTVTAETDQVVSVGPFEVTGLASNQWVVLRGMEVGTGATGTSRIHANAGWVGLEDCNLFPDATTTGSTLEVDACAAVQLVRSIVQGRNGDAVAATASGLHVFDCTILGADAPADGSGGDGHHGIVQDGGTVLIEGGLVQGGTGDDGTGAAFVCAVPPGDGGDGLVLFGAPAPVARLQGATLAGGAGGTNPACSDGTPGSAWVTFSGTVTDLGGVHHGLDVETPERMGQIATNVLTGAPGDIVVLGIGVGPAATWFPPWSGTISVDPVLVTLPMGTVPPTGSFTVDVLIPLFPNFQSVQFFEQAVFVTPAGQITLSTPCYPMALNPVF